MAVTKTDQQDGIFTLTLDRPTSHNSLNAAVYAEILDAIQEAERDDRVRVIVTRSEGRSFSVGADAGNLDGYAGRGLRQTFDEDFSRKMGMHTGPCGALEDLGVGRWVLAVARVEKPWICAVQGVAAGGGFALAMLHHFRIASEKARFTAAFSKLGLGPELGLSSTLPAICGRQAAMAILLSSRMIEAEEAHRLGIVDRLVPHDDLEEKTLEFAGELARAAPLAVRAVLRSLSRRWLIELREALEVEWRDQAVLFSSQDFAEGVSAFAERRSPQFHGS